MADEWYRSPDWSPDEQERFEAKLGRARRTGRAQYLRLKGLALASSADADYRAAASALFHRVLDEYPDEDLQCAMALADLAKWHQERGEDELAARYYRECLDAEERYGSLHTGSELALAELISRSPELGTHSEALALLDQESERGGLPFNINRWRALVVRARIAAQENDAAAARDFAAAALELLANDGPQLPRHPDVGLIRTDDATVGEMRKLVGARPRRSR